jgi:two-component system sensor histidine kinase GlrK
VQSSNHIIKVIASSCAKIETLSIKKLTPLGFTLVALPLVMALIYAAIQINQLASSSEIAIRNTAKLTEDIGELRATLSKMERYASQYLVLNDQELLNNYLLQEDALLSSVDHNLIAHHDTLLSKSSVLLKQELVALTQQLKLKASTTTSLPLSLSDLQTQFKQLVNISQKITDRSNTLITLQVNIIRTSAIALSQTMLNSLVIIPITVVIALFFIYVITKPLKKLTTKIQQFEHGNFEQSITLDSSPEINEIVDALEVMRTRLHALELQKSSFIRHISHELKTPLAAIREGTELLYDHSVGELNAEQQEISHIIRSSVTRLQRLIEDLLSFNIVLDSTSLQDSIPIDIHQLIESVLLAQKLNINRKQLTLNKNVDDIQIQSNEKQLSVIVDNLLSNAIKYSPVHGEITIDCKIVENALHLSVRDQGPGIEPMQQEKIFDAFYQGSPPTDNHIKSSGLGLTIVKELLMRINGTINVQSHTDTAQSLGTHVTITLPKAQYLGKRS